MPKRSIYMSGPTLRLAGRMADKHEESLSAAVADAVSRSAALDYAGVILTEGAVVCLSEGLLDALTAVPLEDGRMLVSVKKAVCETGEFQAKLASLREYIRGGDKKSSEEENKNAQ